MLKKCRITPELYGLREKCLWTRFLTVRACGSSSSMKRFEFQQKLRIPGKRSLIRYCARAFVVFQCNGLGRTWRMRVVTNFVVILILKYLRVQKSMSRPHTKFDHFIYSRVRGNNIMHTKAKIVWVNWNRPTSTSHYFRLIRLNKILDIITRTHFLNSS